MTEMHSSQGTKARVFILDFDGIIATLPIDWEEVRKVVYAETGIDVRGFLDFFKKSWGKPEFEKVSEVVEKFEMAAAYRCAPPEDVRKSLEELRRKECRSYVASMQSTKVVAFFLRQHSLEPFFQRILGRQDAGSKERELEIILVDEKNTSRNQIVFVDDNKRHMGPCKKLGLVCVQFDRRFSDSDLLGLIRSLT